MTVEYNTLQSKRVIPSRALEIKFYFFLKKLAGKYDKNTTDIILQCFVNMSKTEDCTVETVNELYRNFITDRNPLMIPSKEETVYFLNKDKVSVRDIYKYTGISQKTQERIKRDFENKPENIPVDRPHIKTRITEEGKVITDYHTCINDFLNTVEEFNKLW